MDATEALQKYFGYDSFRSSQRAVIDHLLSDQHAMVIMPTGMGKSLCYQIPALVHAAQPENTARGKPLTLVMSPLIALMKDQVDALTRRGIDAAYINSSLGRRDREERYTKLGEGTYAILYVTPERFRKTEFLEVIARRDVRLLGR